MNDKINTTLGEHQNNIRNNIKDNIKNKIKCNTKTLVLVDFRSSVMEFTMTLGGALAIVQMGW